MARAWKAGDTLPSELHPDCRTCVWLNRAGGFLWCEVFEVPTGDLPPQAFMKDGRCSAHLTDTKMRQRIREAMRSNMPLCAVFDEAGERPAAAS